MSTYLAVKYEKPNLGENAWRITQALVDEDYTTGAELLDIQESWWRKHSVMQAHWKLIQGAITPAFKSITVVVNAEDVFGEAVPKSLCKKISSLEQLTNFIKSHGGGSLVQDGTSFSVSEVGGLVDGGTYTLIGGQQEAAKRHIRWTQQADRELEEVSTLAVRDAWKETTGELLTLFDVCLKTYSKTRRVGSGSSTAFRYAFSSTP